MSSAKKKARLATTTLSARVTPKIIKGQANFGSDILPLHFHAPLDEKKIPPQPWQNLPQPTGQSPFRLSLESVLSPDEIQRINATGKLVFHTVGDTGGVNETTDIENVASYMEKDFSPNKGESSPAFFYHLGDVVYYEGQAMNYFAQFYEPYMRYPAPIFAIPGNHDGDVDPTTGEKSLDAFVNNFCARAPIHTPEAKEAPRDAMTQPNVYWTLETPLATIIGLYSNCPEGGELKPDQIAWFESELIAAPKDKALIVAVHHPIYSAFGAHPGSQHLKDVFEQACGKANRIPHAVLSGHVHNYQRFNGELWGEEVPFFVIGAGGYNHRLHVLSEKIHRTKLPIQMPGSVGTLECYCDQNHGYMVVEITKKQMAFKYYAVPETGASPTKALKPYDTITIGLNLK
ncbi:MAG TPA: metallophosphoesterase [Bacteroidota bacterium]|nr:metallophosphoesterase [Bacteroidota bacterium]